MNDLININLLRQILGIDDLVTKDDLTKALANVKSSSECVDEKSSSVEMLLQQINDLKANIAEEQKKNEGLQSQVNQKEKECSVLNSQLSEKSVDLDEANAKINGLERKVSELETQLENKSEELVRVNFDFQQKQSECSVLNSQLSDKSRDLNEANAKINGLKGKVSELETQLENKSEELVCVNSDLQQKIEELKSFDFQALYNQISDDKVRYGVSTYFSKNDNKAMVYGALQQTHCENFYRFVRNQIKEGKKADLPVLMELLNKVFDFFVSYTGYELIEPEIGMGSNSEHSIILSRKMTGGVVEEVLLFGYKDNNGKVIQTALVKVT